MPDAKGSSFTDDAPLTPGDIVFGLRAGANVKFTYGNTAPKGKATAANTSTAYTLDPANGAEFDLTLNGNATITLQTVIANVFQAFPVKITQDGSGGRTLAWANVTWIPGTAPTMPTTASTGTIYCTFFSDGVTWYGNYNPTMSGSGNVAGSVSPTFTGTANFANITTAPTDSHTATAAFASSVTLGTAVQNTTGYDLLVNVGFAVTAATTGTLAVGVGPTSTPTKDTVVPSFSIACAPVISVLVPNSYYLLIDKTGSVTQTNAVVATPL